jgi:acetyltransferase-like isoleucine patch superfamily enzyme
MKSQILYLIKFFLLLDFFFLRRKKVNLNRFVKYNNSTQFEDNIKIYKYASIYNTEIGRGSYIGQSSILNNITVGRFCSIAPNVEVVYGSHPVSNISSHPAFYSKKKQSGFTFCNISKLEDNSVSHLGGKSVVIGNDVWLGRGVKILEGITIGDGSVVGAYAVVTKDIPPYSIVGGIPAKLIRYRFDEEEVCFLNKVKWWNQPFNWIEDNCKSFDSITSLKKALEDNRQNL